MIPSKSTKKKSKPGWEIRLETQIKNLFKKVQNDKTEKKRRSNMLERNKKGNEGKITIQLEVNKPRSNGKRRKIEQISTKGKTI